jgi:hypothetical protein
VEAVQLGIEKSHPKFVPMPRRPAAFTQADIARAVRAAKQTGAAEVEVRVGEQSSIVIRLNSSTGPEKPLEPIGKIVL